MSECKLWKCKPTYVSQFKATLRLWGSSSLVPGFLAKFALLRVYSPKFHGSVKWLNWPLKITIITQMNNYLGNNDKQKWLQSATCARMIKKMIYWRQLQVEMKKKGKPKGIFHSTRNIVNVYPVAHLGLVTLLWSVYITRCSCPSIPGHRLQQTRNILSFSCISPSAAPGALPCSSALRPPSRNSIESFQSYLAQEKEDISRLL